MALGFLLDETDRVFLESCIRDGQSDFDFSLTHSPDSTGIGGEGRVLVHGQGLSCSLLAQDSIILAEYSVRTWTSYLAAAKWPGNNQCS